MSGDIGMYEIYGDPNDVYEDPNEDQEGSNIGVQKLIEYLDKKETSISKILIRSQTKLTLTISIVTLLIVSIVAFSICYPYFGDNTHPMTTTTTTTKSTTTTTTTTTSTTSTTATTTTPSYWISQEKMNWFEARQVILLITITTIFRNIL